MEVRLGYACINTTLESPNRTTTKKYLNKMRDKYAQAQYLYEKCELNIRNLEKLILWNIENNVKVYRLPSEFFPFMGFGLKDLYDPVKKFSSELKRIGRLCRTSGIRLSFHPGQHCVLSSPNPDVVLYTIKEINNNARILKALGSPDPVIVIHGGGKYGDVRSAMDRFKYNFGKLSRTAKSMLVVENDQTIYSSLEAYALATECNIPFIFDVAHHKWNTGGLSIEQAVVASLATWELADRKPKFHISSEIENTKRHAHADMITEKDFQELYDAIIYLSSPQNKDTGVDIMFECKLKEVSVLDIRAKLGSRLEL